MNDAEFEMTCTIKIRGKEFKSWATYKTDDLMNQTSSLGSGTSELVRAVLNAARGVLASGTTG